MKKQKNKFELITKFKPSGDQAEAIKTVVDNLSIDIKDQVLKGVTGSGKTFAMANIIASQNKPALIMSHNKTLASQLYNDIKSFFPNNKVEYFVSNFDFYIPEAFNPKTQAYVDKSSSVNEQLDAMRMSAVNALLSRNDTIIVSSVACIYGALNPKEYDESIFSLNVGQDIKIKELSRKLVAVNYTRNQIDQRFGTFSIKGDVIEIIPGHTDEFIIRILMFGDTIEQIQKIENTTRKIIKNYLSYTIFPASAYSVARDRTNQAIIEIEKELEEVHNNFIAKEDLIKAQRILERTRKDIDDMSETGFCKGMENYSRYFDGRKTGEKPYTLLDYFPEGSLFIIDESHISIGQLKGMYAGDHTRKQNLVDYGYRLPSALDNRPLNFNEFNKYDFNRIYVSATPQLYEIDKSMGLVTEMINRPTGLLDPQITIKPTINQIEVIYDELVKQKENKERTFIITTTVRAAEELTSYLKSKKMNIAYVHGEHNAIERHEILRDLRIGKIDAIVGINLLKEGIDIPEVSLIMILDADATSYTRSVTSLIQIVGRAARNVNGRVILFADRMTENMRLCIEDNERKRKIQIAYNRKNNIIPQTVIKPIPESLMSFDIKDALKLATSKKLRDDNKEIIEAYIQELRNKMKKAADKRDFELAIKYREEIKKLGGDLV